MRYHQRMEIIDQLEQFETIGEITEWAHNIDVEYLRAYLLKAFDAVKYYDTADDWNRAVSICETLAIIGWGDALRVDALVSKRDQWRETSFRCKDGIMHFREARFLPRKAGWYIVNFTDLYASAGDRGDYTEVKESDIVCVPVSEIKGQRNYQVKMQIAFINCGTMCDAAFEISNYTDELIVILKHIIDPDLYASLLEDFCVWVSTGFGRDMGKVKIGQYHSKRKSFTAEVRISRSFSELVVSEKRLVIVKSMREILRGFRYKMKKRRLDFPIAQFESDVEAALKIFTENKKRPSGSGNHDGIKRLLTEISSAVSSRQDDALEDS